MNHDPRQPAGAEDEHTRDQRGSEEPGSNAVEHEPDPEAEPIPDGEHRFIRRSPYTAGND